MPSQCMDVSGEPIACGPIDHQFTSLSFHTIPPTTRGSDKDSNLEILSDRSTHFTGWVKPLILNEYNTPVHIKQIEIQLNIKHIPFHYQTSNILVDITLNSQTTGNFNTQYENIHNQCHGTHCFHHCQKIWTKSLFKSNQEHGRSPISTVSNLTSMKLTIFKNRNEYCPELCVTFPFIPPQIETLQLSASRIVSIMKHVLTHTLFCQINTIIRHCSKRDAEGHFHFLF